MSSALPELLFGNGGGMRAFLGRYGGWLIFPLVVAVGIAAAPFVGTGVSFYALLVLVAFILVLTFSRFRSRG